MWPQATTAVYKQNGPHAHIARAVTRLLSIRAVIKGLAGHKYTNGICKQQLWRLHPEYEAIQ